MPYITVLLSQAALVFNLATMDDTVNSRTALLASTMCNVFCLPNNAPHLNGIKGRAFPVILVVPPKNVVCAEPI